MFLFQLFKFFLFDFFLFSIFFFFWVLNSPGVEGNLGNPKLDCISTLEENPNVTIEAKKDTSK